MEVPVSRVLLALACVLFAAPPALSADLYAGDVQLKGQAGEA